MNVNPFLHPPSLFLPPSRVPLPHPCPCQCPCWCQSRSICPPNRPPYPQARSPTCLFTEAYDSQSLLWPCLCQRSTVTHSGVCVGAPYSSLPLCTPPPSLTSSLGLTHMCCCTHVHRHEHRHVCMHAVSKSLRHIWVSSVTDTNPIVWSQIGLAIANALVISIHEYNSSP